MKKRHNRKKKRNNEIKIYWRRRKEKEINFLKMKKHGEGIYSKCLKEGKNKVKKKTDGKCRNIMKKERKKEKT